MGVVIEICVKYPGGPTRIRVTDIILYCTLFYNRLLIFSIMAYKLY
jgi:hypothetical protein